MACISYMTWGKNLLLSSVSTLFGDRNQWFENPILLLLLAGIVPTYLALKRRVSALRYASLYGIIVILIAVFLVIITYFEWCSDDGQIEFGDDQHHPSDSRECLADSISNH